MGALEDFLSQYPQMLQLGGWAGAIATFLAVPESPITKVSKNDYIHEF